MAGTGHYFSFRLFSHDFGLESPDRMDAKYSEFMEREIYAIPIIRLYGTSLRGQKVCLHVHNYLPYFYTSFPHKIARSDDKGFIRALAEAIERCYATQQELSKFKPSEKQQIIDRIEIVEQTSFYGYHPRPEKFLKIYIYQPDLLKPLGNMMSSGCLFGEEFQPFEVHLSYLTKFYRDFNLFGMELVNIFGFSVRLPLSSHDQYTRNFPTHFQKDFMIQDCPVNSTIFILNDVLNLRLIDEETLDDYGINANNFLRQSKCDLEIDCCIENILNQEDQSETMRTPCSSVSTKCPENLLDYTQLLLSAPKENFELSNITDMTHALHSLNSHIILNYIKVQTSIIKKIEKADGLCSPLVPRSLLPIFERITEGNKSVGLSEMGRSSDLNPEALTIISSKDSNSSLNIKPEETQSPAKNSELTYSIYNEYSNMQYPFAEKESQYLKIVHSLSNLWKEELCRRVQHSLPPLTINIPLIHFVYQPNDLLHAEATQVYVQKILDSYKSVVFTEKVEEKKWDSLEEINRRVLETHYSREKDKKMFMEVMISKWKEKYKTADNIKMQEKQIAIEAAEQKEIHDLLEVMSFRNWDRIKRVKRRRDVVDNLSIKSFLKITKKRATKQIDRKSRDTITVAIPKKYSFKLSAPSTHKILQKSTLQKPSYLDVHFSSHSDYDEYLAQHKNKSESKREHYTHVFPSHLSLNEIHRIKHPIYLRPDIAPPSHCVRRIHSLIYQPLTNSRLTFLSESPNIKKFTYRFKLQAPKSSSIKQSLQKRQVLDSQRKRVDEYLHRAMVTPLSDSIQTPPDSEKPKQYLQELYQELRENNSLVTMYLEVYCAVEEDREFDALRDSITCVFFRLDSETAQLSLKDKYQTVYIMIEYNLHDIGTEEEKRTLVINNSQFLYYKVSHEIKLIELFIQIIHRFDPDVIIGYNLFRLSLGYMAKRCEFMKIPLLKLIARCPILFDFSTAYKNLERAKKITTFTKFHQRISVNGRMLIDCLNTVASEKKYFNYDYENVMFQMFGQTVPCFRPSFLFKLYNEGQGKFINFFRQKLDNTYKILSKLETLNKIIEFSRLYGVDPDCIEARGSQFKVEAILSRVTYRLGYILLSFTKQQTLNQPITQIIPLVIEPERQFYCDPVIILDFQSLYPSIIISHNICYSTCLGKLNPDAFRKKFFSLSESLPLSNMTLEDFSKSFIMTPNMVGFAKPHVREGVLPLLLKDILETRIMIKKSMRLYESGGSTQRMLESWQMGLKLWANVLYGYSAATFTGRMPCSDIADSVISLARKTLEHTINYVNSNKTWGAEVIYGDTDSLFVLVKGRTVAEAFKIGAEIAKTITRKNPPPMELKLEKIFCPFILLAKKRYSGMQYEQPEQTIPTLLSKGLENIRTDSCACNAKIMDTVLRILFSSKDISQIRKYLFKQWSKIFTHSLSLLDAIFFKKVHIGSYKNPHSLPPAALVCEKRMTEDPGFLPSYNERVKYVIVERAEPTTLRDMAVSPEDYLANPALRLHTRYYIEKQINSSLDRVLCIFGINIDKWYLDFLHSPPSVISKHPFNPTPQLAALMLLNKSSINQYIHTGGCFVCRSKSQKNICERCSTEKRNSCYILEARASVLERRLADARIFCTTCAAVPDIEESVCINFNCPVFHMRSEIEMAMRISKVVEHELHESVLL